MQRVVPFLAALLAAASAARGQADPDCTVAGMDRIGVVGPGLDWHPTDPNQIAIARADSSGTYQVYLIRPDGSDIRCLTCATVPGSPGPQQHKGVPHWHPSGRYIFLQVEQAKHKTNRSLTQPGSGRNNDIWATTPSGDRWWQLTDGSKNADSGTLFPVPSHAGDRLAWAERFAGPAHPFSALAGLIAKNPPSDIWGRWQLAIGDLSFDSDGAPRLQHVQKMAPGNADFYEMQGWGAGDRSLYFAASIGRKSPYTLDIWRMDLPSKSLTPITDTDNQWEEHISFSRSFRKAVFMSSECCAWDSGDLKTLVAELYLMNGDGSNRVQLTKFNTPGSKEFARGVRSVVAKGVWSPDGRHIAFARILIRQDRAADRTGSPNPTDLWLLTFAGPCGR